MVIKKFKGNPQAKNSVNNTMLFPKVLPNFHTVQILGQKAKQILFLGDSPDTHLKKPHMMSVPLYFPRRRKREEDISRVQHQKSKEYEEDYRN